MKEKIYTIPVSEVFSVVSECPLCLLFKRLEDEQLSYVLGSALMEPDFRNRSNEKGFCKNHYEKLYNRQENRLGLGLITDTLLAKTIGQFEELAKAAVKNPYKKKKSFLSFVKIGQSGNSTSSNGNNTYPPNSPVDKLIEWLDLKMSSCLICEKTEYTIERYTDVIFYLWETEKEFREKFMLQNGFCLPHYRHLLDSMYKYLRKDNIAGFVKCLTDMQTTNLKRISGEVNWFTLKFDYKNKDKAWGNSRDAMQRSIQKLKGTVDIK